MRHVVKCKAKNTSVIKIPTCEHSTHVKFFVGSATGFEKMRHSKNERMRERVAYAGRFTLDGVSLHGKLSYISKLLLSAWMEVTVTRCIIDIEHEHASSLCYWAPTGGCFISWNKLATVRLL